MNFLRRSVQAKLTAVSIALVAAVVLVSGAVLESRLREALDARLEGDLLRQANAVETLLQQEGVAEADAFTLAEVTTRAAGLRFSLIDGQGQVLADSHVSDARLAGVQDHTLRPEVAAARAGGVGVARRHSSTVDADMLYVARQLKTTAGPTDRVLRVAMPVTESEALIAGVRRALGLTVAVGLGLAIIMSLWSARVMTQNLRELVTKARALAENRTRARIRLGSDDELEHLAGSVNRLAGEVDDTRSTLQAERDLVHAVVEGIGDGVVAIDNAGLVVLMNSAAHALLRRAEDASWVPIAEILPTVDVAALLRAGDDAPAVELELPGPPVRRVLVHASRTSVEEGVVLLLEDVTDVRRLENVRREFVANVSHELRTPVSVIRASAEALIHGGLEDPERAIRFASALHRNAERLSRLISDLLDLARIESGRHAITVQPVGLWGLVDDIAFDRQTILDERRHTLVIDVADDIAVLADRSGLEQVITNLVDNAAKYTPAGGRIDIRARVVDDVVSIEVEDNGPGIPLEHRDRIFERFYRVDAGRSREMGGTGLGLSIVKHLVVIMGGDVRVEAGDGGGARFVVELPRG